MNKQERFAYLRGLHTRELLSMRDYCYKMGGQFSPFDNGVKFSLGEVKKELETREHVPNKKEARQIRQEKAKRKA